MSQARVVALTQEHRGHGVSTMAYYLGRVLVAQGLRVLLVDLTDRRGQAAGLMARAPIRNLVAWRPPLAHARDVSRLLERARCETTGKADVILLDIDAAVLESAGGYGLGLDYLVVVVEAAESGLKAADRLAERFGQEGTSARLGVIYSRVEGSVAPELPLKSERRELPVLGQYPADYLLAGGVYAPKGDVPCLPHASYRSAMVRLGRCLARIVPLARGSTLVGVERHVSPHEAESQTLA